MCLCVLGRVQLFATPWTVTLQAALSMGFSKQEFWNGLLFPTPVDLPHPGVEFTLAGGFFTYSIIKINNDLLVTSEHGVKKLISLHEGQEDSICFR